MCTKRLAFDWARTRRPSTCNEKVLALRGLMLTRRVEIQLMRTTYNTGQKTQNPSPQFNIFSNISAHYRVRITWKNLDLLRTSDFQLSNIVWTVVIGSTMLALRTAQNRCQESNETLLSDNCTPNIVPCKIHHDGPVEIPKRYWNPNKDDDGKKSEASCLLAGAYRASPQLQSKRDRR